MSAKPPPRFNLLPILLGIVVFLVGAVWKTVSARPRRQDGRVSKK